MAIHATVQLRRNRVPVDRVGHQRRLLIEASRNPLLGVEMAQAGRLRRVWIESRTIH
jgi:hypothetical protein